MMSRGGPSGASSSVLMVCLSLGLPAPTLFSALHSTTDVTLISLSLSLYLPLSLFLFRSLTLSLSLSLSFSLSLSVSLSLPLSPSLSPSLSSFLSLSIFLSLPLYIPLSPSLSPSLSSSSSLPLSPSLSSSPSLPPSLSLTWSWWCTPCWAAGRSAWPGWRCRTPAPCPRSASWRRSTACTGWCSGWWETDCLPGPPRTGWPPCWSSPAPPAGAPWRARPEHASHRAVSVGVRIRAFYNYKSQTRDVRRSRNIIAKLITRVRHTLHTFDTTYRNMIDKWKKNSKKHKSLSCFKVFWGRIRALYKQGVPKKKNLYLNLTNWL